MRLSGYIAIVTLSGAWKVVWTTGGLTNCTVPFSPLFHCVLLDESVRYKSQKLYTLFPIFPVLLLKWTLIIILNSLIIIENVLSHCVLHCRSYNYYMTSIVAGPSGQLQSRQSAFSRSGTHSHTHVHMRARHVVTQRERECDLTHPSYSTTFNHFCQSVSYNYILRHRYLCHQHLNH